MKSSFVGLVRHECLIANASYGGKNNPTQRLCVCVCVCVCARACVCVNRATLNGRLANEISLKGGAERDKEDKERSRLGAINTIHSNYEK